MAPAFHGSPIPKHRVGEGERAAVIVMSYFHPWTTRNSDACAHVPHVSQLRGDHDSWKDALAGWLDGGIISLESKRYIGNFLCVYIISVYLFIYSILFAACVATGRGHLDIWRYYVNLLVVLVGN